MPPGFSGAATSLWKVPASGAGEPEQLPFTRWRGLQPSHLPERQPAGVPAESGRLQHMASFAVGPGSGQRPPSSVHCTRHALIWLHNTLPTASESPLNPTAVESMASGSCDADGSNADGVFLQAGTSCGTARWSPDGQRIAFDFNAEGNIDIYVIRASGGKPIALTTDPADDVAPSWSRDGKWVYFTSKRTGRYEVWKVSAGGGKAVPVTRNGGGTAFESPDGKSIYYTKGDFSGSLWKMPVSGGEESQVLPSVVNRALSFSSTRGSISFRSRAPMGSLLSSF